MHKTIAILAGAALALSGLSAQAQTTRKAGTPMQVQMQSKATILHIGMDASGKVVVQSTDGASAFALDPATGGTIAVQPEPVEQAKPLPGIGIVVKKHPGGSAERAIPVGGDGNASIPSDLEDGSYDLTIRIPRSSLATNSSAMASARTASPAGNAVMRLTFVSNAGGIQGVLRTRTKSNQANE